MPVTRNSVVQSLIQPVPRDKTIGCRVEML
jgi:hypothetical protein